MTLNAMCSIPGCSRPYRALDYCESHYKRFKKYGDPLAGRAGVPRKGNTRMDFFKAKVNYNGPVSEYRPDLGSCHIWIGALSEKGYGSFFNERNQSAHTWLWTEVNGPIPQGMVPDHLCRVRACVNLNHLEIVTNGENTLRGMSFSAVNKRKTHCNDGHELTPENCYDYTDRRHCKICARLKAAKRLQENRDAINERRRELRAARRRRP